MTRWPTCCFVFLMCQWDPAAALNLGNLLRNEPNTERAVVAYRLAIDSGVPEIAALAAVNLGTLLHEQGDVARAIDAYRLAIASRHPDRAPIAALNLGRLLEQQGDLAGARIAYRRAVRPRHTVKKVAPEKLRALRSSARRR